MTTPNLKIRVHPGHFQREQPAHREQSTTKLFFSETIPYKRTVRNSSWFWFPLQNAAEKGHSKRAILERPFL